MSQLQIRVFFVSENLLLWPTAPMHLRGPVQGHGCGAEQRERPSQVVVWIKDQQRDSSEGVAGHGYPRGAR